jgi:hypothetical protein
MNVLQFGLILCVSLFSDLAVSQPLSLTQQDEVVNGPSLRNRQSRHPSESAMWSLHLAPHSLLEKLDLYSLEFFSIFRLKSFAKSTARTTRVVSAVGLSFMLVFLIFVLAIQLQRAVILGAFEDAEHQEPLLYRAEMSDSNSQSIFTADAIKAA